MVSASEFPFSLDDFATEEPYKYLWNIHENSSEFVYEAKKEALAAYAKKLGFSRFKTMLRAFEASCRKDKKALHTIYNQNLVTRFDQQPLELDCGDWDACDYGIFRESVDGRRECACAHPILPIERLVNLDTGEVKLKLAFKQNGRNSQWQTVIVEKETVSSSRSITALSKFGISVTSNSAKCLVDYLNDIENRNYDVLMERRSISRCGYMRGAGFSPFVENLVFDGDLNFKSLFQSIRTNGDELAWAKVAMECRKMSVTARIMLSASLASILLEPFGALPFFVHLWGSESGTGKTVALMLASSVWGDPALGSYTSTFNATTVGCEYMASFLNHLPLCLDELQLSKDSQGKAKFDVYQLAQGVGRARGSKNGGLCATPTWKNCILTTGESPLVNLGAGAGAINRVIDIECTAKNVVIYDGMRISSLLRQNFGFAGRRFVGHIYGDDDGWLDAMREGYQNSFSEFSKSDTTEKQAMAAAVICVADSWLTTVYLKDGLPPLEDEIEKFLASKQAVSIGVRAYDYLCGWVAANANKLKVSESGDVYGIVEGTQAYIIRNIFDKALMDAGFSIVPVLSYFKAEGIIETHPKGFTKTRRINGIPTNCVVLNLKCDEETDDELPL